MFLLISLDSSSLQILLPVAKSKKKAVATSVSKKRKIDEVEETPEMRQVKDECLEQLLETRNQISNHNGITNPEIIAGINVLRGLAEKLPRTTEDMFEVVGVTESWYQTWGDDFLQVCVHMISIRQLINKQYEYFLRTSI